jgi:hypothetical protein
MKLLKSEALRIIGGGATYYNACAKEKVNRPIGSMSVSIHPIVFMETVCYYIMQREP